MVVAGTAVRPLDCSRRSTNDLLGRHPASTGGADHAGVAAGVGGHAARLRCEVGEGPLSSTPTESMVARVALGGPPASLAPQPSAPAPTHRSAPRRPPPYAPQIDRRPSPLSRARRPRAAPSRPACRPAPPRGASSPRLLRPGGRGALEGVALRRVCLVGSPVRAGSSRPRGPLELDPHGTRDPPPYLAWALGALALGAWGRPFPVARRIP